MSRHHLRLMRRGRAILELAGYDQRFTGANRLVRHHIDQPPRMLYAR